MSITLTGQEKKIVAILQQVAASCGTVVRIAGGWVRDRLLGRESKDIDICLENMTGLEFALAAAKTLGIQETKIGVIKANPDQSKHLETVTMTIEGIPIDMVNLRNEWYAEGSRIPRMAMGTAAEDAFRRDLTFNALFYNIHTGDVEDFTGRGLDDLEKGVVRTPLPGVQTFLDDPLRTMRVIRFAIRFGFDIAPETLEAMACPEVHEAFRKKIAPERILREINEALLGDPCRAIRILMDTNLGDVILPELKPMNMDHRSRFHDKTILEFTLAILDHIHQVAPDNLPLKLTALLHDVGKPKTAAPNKEGGLSFIRHECEGQKMAEEILDRMRYPKAVTSHVTRMVGLHMFPHSPAQWSDLRFFRWLRQVARTPQDLADLLTLREADIRGYAPQAREARMKEFREFGARLETIDVPAVLGMKPLVDGVELQRRFGRPGGPWIRNVQERLLELQCSGKLHTREEALAYLADREVSDTGSLRRRPVSRDEAARRKREALGSRSRPRR